MKTDKSGETVMHPHDALPPPYPSGRTVLRLVNEAITQLGVHDFDLFHVDAHERSITHKLAEHLQRLFPYWHVDCEYNRDDDEAKRLGQEYEHAKDKYEPLKPYDTEAKTVYLDIIVHRRCTHQNLLVIEAKKESSRCSTSVDENKLRCFTRRCGHFRYRYGLLLTFGRTADETPCQRWFIDGEERCTACIRKL